MSKTSYIDWDKRIIVGKSGKVYNIAPEKIASKLWAQYQIRGSLLAFNMSLESLVTRQRQGIECLRNGKENSQGNTANALTYFEGIFDGFRKYVDNDFNATIEFLSIFCKTENEPVDQNDESIIRRKYDDWSEIPQADLFYLSQRSTPWYQDYLKMQVEEETKANGLKSEGLPENEPNKN